MSSRPVVIAGASGESNHYMGDLILTYLLSTRRIIIEALFDGIELVGRGKRMLMSTG